MSYIMTECPIVAKWRFSQNSIPYILRLVNPSVR